jgi:hypothetical protein
MKGQDTGDKKMQLEEFFLDADLLAEIEEFSKAELSKVDQVGNVPNLARAEPKMIFDDETLKMLDQLPLGLENEKQTKKFELPYQDLMD